MPVVFDAAAQDVAELHLTDGIGQEGNGTGKIQRLWEGDPRRVGRYRLVGRLGAGGMGEVFVGRSPAGRTVAVKLMHPSLASKPAFRERFAREAAAAGRVGGAFTAAVVESDAQASRPWLATVFVPAMSLEEAVTSLGPLPEDATALLGAGLVEALEAIHKAGITHRDLKPSNVLLAADGPKVIDFGIAAAAEGAALTTTGSVLGTLGYMPPERLLGHRKDADLAGEGDVFALGAVLAFTATGRNPFGADSAEMAYRTVHTPPQMDGVTARLRQVVEKCLTKEPEERPGLAALLEELLAVASSSGAVRRVAGTEWLPPTMAAMVLRYARAQVPDAGADDGGPEEPKPEESGPTNVPRPTNDPVATGGSEPAGPEPGVPAPAVRVPAARASSARVAAAPLREQPELTADFPPAARVRSPVKEVGGHSGKGTTERGPTTPRRRVLTGAAVLAGAGFAGGFGGGWMLNDRPESRPRREPQTRKLWSFQASNGMWSSPTVVDRVVYVGCFDGRLYALDATTGRQGWSYQTGAEVNTSPAVADGMVYFGSWDDCLYAVDAATGKERWVYETGNQVDSSPAVADGVVYVGSWDGHLHAVDAATGRRRWTYGTGDQVHSSPTVAHGIVYVGSGDENLHAVDAATGRRHWTHRTGGKVDSSPTVAHGIVYVGSSDENLHAVDAATGRRRWSFRTRRRAFQRDNQVLSSPAVAAGTVYFGGYNHYLYAVDAATGRQRWSFETEGPVASSPAVADGVVYVGSLDGCLYAFRGTRP